MGEAFERSDDQPFEIQAPVVDPPSSPGGGPAASAQQAPESGTGHRQNGGRGDPARRNLLRVETGRATHAPKGVSGWPGAETGNDFPGPGRRAMPAGQSVVLDRRAQPPHDHRALEAWVRRLPGCESIHSLRGRSNTGVQLRRPSVDEPHAVLLPHSAVAG